MQLNEGQEAAAQAVFQFLLSEDREFILSGPAGVGKTFMMDYIATNIMEQYRNGCKLLGIPITLNRVQFTATTNKAAEVLRNSIGQDAMTIHSFLGLKVREDFRKGTYKLEPTGASVVHSHTVLFCDESSMIDKVLHGFISKFLDNSCKIIYVGDHCQMAPVGETLSLIYENPKHFVTLTQPVRNAGQPALMALCNQLRDTVETGVFKPIQEVPGVIDYIDDTKLKDLLDNQFCDEDLNARILCYTNARVQEYNEYIREVRGYPDLFQPGEILVNNNGMEFGKIMLRVEQQFRVMEIVKQPYDLELDPRTGTSLEVYEIRIRAVGRESFEIVVKIPTDPEHYNKLCKHYASLKNWDIFWHLKKNYPDLRQKDAATVYKAQGSTYEWVIADLANIDAKCFDPEQVARMLYVAASRATTRIYFYGRLTGRYNRS